MVLLALSTSTPRGSAALLDAADPGARVIAAASYVDLRGHAERIFGVVSELLAGAGIGRGAITAIGCDVGPGSFTGVRVGVASAKGIAMSLGIPAIGVPSLEAMAAAAFAEGAASAGDLVVPLIDAKKGELFLAAFDAPGGPPRLAPQHLLREAARGVLDAAAGGRRVVVVGEVAEEIDALRPLRARGPALDLPDAAWIGRVALARRALSEPEGPARAGSRPTWKDAYDAALLEPLYVRAPDAKPAELGYAPPR